MPIALSGSLVLSGSITVSGSISSTGGITISGSIASASYAATSSYANTFTVANTLTAQTLVVQTITSSVSYLTGSTQHGQNTGNTHQFTGSVLVSGSNTFTGNANILTLQAGSTTGDVRLKLNSAVGSSYFGVDNSSGNVFNAGAYTTHIYTDNISSSIAFSTNQSTKMFISTSGNVGIGTTSPNFPLTIDKTSSYTLGLLNSNIGTVGQYTGLTFGYTGTTYQKGALYFVSKDANGVGDFIFALNNTANGTNTSTSDERMRITSAGNVGIGATSPLNKLHIGGSTGIRVSDETGANFRGITFGATAADATEYSYIKWQPASGEFRIYANTSGFGGYTTFYSNNTESMRITSGGNVGIGVTNPSTFKLWVGGSQLIDGTLQMDSGVLNSPKAIAFNANSSTGGTYGDINWYNVQWDGNTRGSINVESDGALANGRMIFKTGASGANAVERMRITSGGNVGIGTTSPYSRLDINGGNIRMGEILNSASSYIGKQYSANSNFYSSIQFYSTSGEDAIIFNSHLSGISSGERMRITGGGNLLVGTTSDTGWKFRVISSTDGAQITSSGSSQTLNLLNASANPTILRMSNNNGNFWDIQNNPSVNSLTFDYNDTTRFSINADGSLIIGRQLGNQYSMTSGGGTGTAIVDTGITYNTGDYGGYGRGVTYQVVYNGNPNGAGSGAYFGQYAGILIIYTGWSGSAVTTYIQYTQLAGGSNMGTLTLTPVFWNGSSEVSSIGYSVTGYQIRLKISGYNSSYTGQDQSVYLTRLS